MKRTNNALALATLALLAACSSSSGDGETGGSTAELGQQAAETYAQIAFQAYSDAIEAATAMDDALSDFVNEPSTDSQDAAKAAWLAAREPYLQTEVYRFYDGPIDNPTDGPESALNAWPMDEQHVDYTRDSAVSGIINDTELPINEATLRGANEAGGEENIAVGYHPIEFLLWGQDDTDPSNGLPGQRSFTDYLTEGGTAENQVRRGEYLDLLGDLLLDDLSTVLVGWSAGDEDNYRAAFLSDGWEQALEKMLTGMIILSGFETGGERLQVALDNGDQEDEHSCFSDNTHRDMVQDVRGVQNVWLGEYAALDADDSVSGTGVRAVVASLEPELAVQISEQIAESLRLAEALRPTPDDPPFDVLISVSNTEGNAKIQALIDSLHAQENLLSQAFAAFGLNVPEPE